MAMPLTGFDDEPSSPVMREETTEKKKPNTMMATAERTETPSPGTALSWGRKDMKRARATEPPSTTEIGMSRSVRALLARPSPPAQPQVAEGRAEAVDDGGHRLHEVDDPARGHRPRADVADVAAPDVERAASGRWAPSPGRAASARPSPKSAMAGMSTSQESSPPPTMIADER